ncbi:MAG: uroporphyrinogen-III C-methyltransferase [Arhodomonas sp.]|nr:uroporphyrinogen-III C-methyltransferase [Arhodomonas sp.]
MPLRPIEERYFLRENLRLRLEGARLAALQGDTSTYRDGLERAREWLQRYYDGDDPAVAEAWIASPPWPNARSPWTCRRSSRCSARSASSIEGRRHAQAVHRTAAAHR